MMAMAPRSRSSGVLRLLNRPRFLEIKQSALQSQ